MPGFRHPFGKLRHTDLRRQTIIRLRIARGLRSIEGISASMYEEADIP